MEESDIIVQELPVFLSKTLAENIHIFQYPTKPAASDFSKTQVKNSLIKPKMQDVKLEIGLDVQSEKYSSEKGEKIALFAEQAQQQSLFKSGMMDKISYSSTVSMADCSKYVIAVLKDKEIHCKPFKSIFQMRPSHTYLEKLEKCQKDVKNVDSSSDEEESEHITVKFARPESDIARKVTETAYAYQQQQNSLEPWYDCAWLDEDSACADVERMKLI